MKKITLLLGTIFLLNGCATYKTKMVNTSIKGDKVKHHTPDHSIMVFGNFVNSEDMDMGEILSKKRGVTKNLIKNTTVVFMGNSISTKTLKNGKPSKKGIALQLHNYKELLDTKSDNILFIPGKTEWENGVDWLEKIEESVDENIGKKSFLPEDSCPLGSKKIGNNVLLITVDSQWYLSDWDKNPKINDNCEIKDREKFFNEFEGLVKKNIDKILVIAIHHPVMSNGNYGGQYSLGQNLTPLPLLGSIKTISAKLGGFNTDQLQNEKYRSFRKRLMTLSRYNEKVIFVSAHEQNLQHIFNDDIHQVISGSLIKTKPVRLMENGLFASGSKGYARIDFYDNGRTAVNFYDDAGILLYRNKIFEGGFNAIEIVDKDVFPKDTLASIYRAEDTAKSRFHKWFWGERYRDYYSKPISVPVINLDTLLGGMTVLRKGGGHQSKSLRLKSKKGQEYVLRALEKSAEAYLQAIVSKEEYIIGRIKGTTPERVLKDFYTGSHPYAPFVVGKLADAIDIYHTNPKLCYIPKQKVLGKYNDEFGDRLFMIEERVTSGHGDKRSFGYANKIIGTDELVANLAFDEKYKVDLDTYIRARLFDMFLGDWDRHDDQWRWAEFKEEHKGKVIYRPIPRDRDQVFSKMGDGFLMGTATRIVPSLRLMEGFDDDIRSVKGFNSSPKTFSLDMLLLPETTEEQWIAQARRIQQEIDSEIIDQAFEQFPPEIHDNITSWIKNALISRKNNLVETAKEYYKVINNISTVVGTDKDDYFSIEYLGNGKAKVQGHRIIKGQKGVKFFDKTYSRRTTKEIWIYGLDDKDKFVVIGNQKRGPKVRLIGGLNNDTYDISKRKQVFVYDYRSQQNTFKSKNGKKRLSDNYDVNTYNPYNVKEDQNFFLPFLGYNPDEGIQLLATNTYTHNGFIKEPFTSQHHINAGFYFATSGFDISYQADFARFTQKGHLRIKAEFTSPNYTTNFFGFGNETPNFDDVLDFDFNRVKIETISFEPSVVWHGKQGSEFSLGGSYEKITVEETADRFVEEFYNINSDIDNENDFLGVNAEYIYENINNKAFPTLGMAFTFKSGYMRNVSNSEDAFGYIIPELTFHYPLISSRGIIFSSRLGGQVNFGNDFQFFQGANLGAENGLRGYRFQRFTGKRSFYQSSDLKMVVGSLKTSFVPLYLGFYGGFDYGRVWIEDDNSNIWNTSYGGGLFVNGIGLITLHAGLFNSDDGNRLNIGFSVGF